MGKGEVVNSIGRNCPLHDSEVYRFSIASVVLVFFGFLLVFTCFIWLFLSAISEFISADKIGALTDLGLSLILFYFGVFNLGYHLLLNRSNLIALVLQDDVLYVCTVKGLQAIPKSKVRGCKSPVHRNNRSFKSGLVEIVVSSEHRVLGPLLLKSNPMFYGASIDGETEQSITKKIRTWKKNTGKKPQDI